MTMTMIKRIPAPSAQHILVVCRDIRETWSEQEEHRRQELATRKQARLVAFLLSKAGSSTTRVA